MDAQQEYVKERVKNFIVDQFLFGFPGDLSPEDSLLEKGVMDSTGVLQLVDFVEETFGFPILDQEMTPANLDGIDRIVAYVRGKTLCK
jgi:acyl carrier protein